MISDVANVVVCDALQLSFIFPIGLCGIAAACDVLAARGQQVRFENLSPSMTSYFERMDVFERCHIEHENTTRRHDRSDRLLEIRCLETPREVDSVANALVSAVTGEMMEGRDDREDPNGMEQRPSEKLFLSLQYVLSELLENAVTHAQANGFAGARVWVAANYYQQTSLVRVAFVDTGCGFLQSLRFDSRVKESPNDFTAIRRALEPFVSCNQAVGILDDSSNQGIGLTVCADIARSAGGRLLVGSGRSSVNAIDGTAYDGTRHWQGAAVDVLLNRDELLSLDLPALVRPYQADSKPALRFE